MKKEEREKPPQPECPICGDTCLYLHEHCQFCDSKMEMRHIESVVDDAYMNDGCLIKTTVELYQCENCHRVQSIDRS